MQSQETDLTLADKSHCVIFALIPQTNLLNFLGMFVWEYGKSQTISSWRYTERYLQEKNKII